MIRGIRVVAAGLIVAVALLLGAVAVSRYAPQSRIGRVLTFSPQPETGTALAELAIGGPFELVDTNGHRVTQASFPGRWQLIYFGYTTCPDICPTTLQAIAGALRLLGAQADRIVPLFITIDPARDQPAMLARYTALFDRRIIGLTGSAVQLHDAERSFRVYAARVDQPGSGSYLMDHTSFIYLMDPDGKLQDLFGHDVTATSLAARLRKAVS